MRPIFVGGCPRSGTTMLGAMLGAHRACLAIPESQFIIELLGSPALAEPFDVARVSAAVGGHFRFKTWGVEVRPPDVEESRGVASYPDLIEWLVEAYGRAVERPEPLAWVEHSPLNASHAATLLELFPEARMIHLVRDGRAVSASVLGLEWGPNEIDVAARWWARRLAPGLAAESHLGPERVQRVRYEDLVAEPEPTLRRLCAFLELDFEPGMLRADGLRVPEFSGRWHALVGSEPDPRRLDAWRRELSERQIEIFESLTGDLLRYLGYAPRYGARARAMGRREKLVSSLRDHLFRRRLNWLRLKLALRRAEKGS